MSRHTEHPGLMPLPVMGRQNALGIAGDYPVSNTLVFDSPETVNISYEGSRE
ncbi:MAG: hypothetical protein JSW37_07765 [Anaerolineales bacterium]|nr:MAG: hypothetical protein JSW37_07765 [Anaerolineales bacterium]